tara:strand:+ start:146 stop:844 length:699 start_codon:yes stop_codon:yes gene_type:complete
VDRVSRFLSGKKQDKIRVVNFQPSVQSMREGEEVLFFNKNGSLSRYRKEKGLLWRSDMNHNGNQSIDNNLQIGNKTTTGILEYKNKFIDHRIFIHNFSDNIGTDVTFLPWQGTGEQANMNNATSAFLTPYTMTCHKILFRPESLAGATSADISFTIHRQDDGDTSTDTVARFTHTPELVSNTLLTVNESDFDNPPTIEAGAKVGISISATIDPAGGTIDYYITSVWRVEVEI